MREVVGEGVRRAREAAGARQDDVARAARRYGLTWSRSKVAALERGAKPVSIEELALLTLVLSDVCARPVTVPELIDPGALVHLAGTLHIGGEGLARVLAGRPLDTGPMTTAETLAVADAYLSGIRHDRERARALLLDEATLDPGGEAEEKAARRLGEPQTCVTALSIALWGRTLTEERDRIVAERDDAPSPDRLRALRGQVTRRLVTDLAEEITRREAAQ
ncbi:helix-turn-helix domain-containing protein [Parafrankia sp. BMG5.11]|uniref:helix-turn-helix domain-containing protein n=1 Tax=Parafrankia sp. BMG5.11 TaxID=222540 RepID=UPI0014055CA3|nr:helix-turn-helix domain-containing protein [Parafrankia sp. BMG5.11]